MHAAVGKGDAAGHRIGAKRRGVEALRPIAARRVQAAGGLAVLDGGVEGGVLIDRRVEGPEGGQGRAAVDALEPGQQRLQRIGFDEVRIVEVVLGIQQIENLGVEELPGALPGLFQHRLAVLGIGVIAKIPAFVDEAPALRINHDAEKVADLAVMFALAVGDVQIAVFLHLPIHGRGVGAAVAAVPRGAELQRHAQAVAGIVRRAAHPRGNPVLAHEFAAQFPAGFEAAAGQNDRRGVQSLRRAIGRPRLHARDPLPLDQQFAGRAGVLDAAAQAFEGRPFGLEQADALVVRAQGQTAPEDKAALLFEGLARVDRLELDLVLGQPVQGGQRFSDQDFLFPAQGPAVVEIAQVVAKLRGRVAAEIGARQARIAGIEQQRQQILPALVGKAHGAGGVLGVAAGHGRRRFFDDLHPGAPFGGRDAGAQGGIARADHDNVDVVVADGLLSFTHACGSRLPRISV